MAALDNLDASEAKELLGQLNYLNLGEIRDFCRPRHIPWIIKAEHADGKVRSTAMSDRKAIVLDRVRHYLQTGHPGHPTVFPASAVSDEPLPAKLNAGDRIHYGQYRRDDEALMTELRQHTDGKFRDGAIARIELVDYWTKGEAPTIAEFAHEWERRNVEGFGVDRGDHPEAAYLTDLSKGTAGADWKTKRVEIAKRCLTTLNKIDPVGN